MHFRRPFRLDMLGQHKSVVILLKHCSIRVLLAYKLRMPHVLGIFAKVVSELSWHGLVHLSDVVVCPCVKCLVLLIFDPFGAIAY